MSLSTCSPPQGQGARESSHAKDTPNGDSGATGWAQGSQFGLQNRKTSFIFRAASQGSSLTWGDLPILRGEQAKLS